MINFTWPYRWFLAGAGPVIVNQATVRVYMYCTYENFVSHENLTPQIHVIDLTKLETWSQCTIKSCACLNATCTRMRGKQPLQQHCSGISVTLFERTAEQS